MEVWAVFPYLGIWGPKYKNRHNFSLLQDWKVIEKVIESVSMRSFRNFYNFQNPPQNKSWFGTEFPYLGIWGPKHKNRHNLSWLNKLLESGWRLVESLSTRPFWNLYNFQNTPKICGSGTEFPYLCIWGPKHKNRHSLSLLHHWKVVEGLLKA